MLAESCSVLNHRKTPKYVNWGANARSPRWKLVGLPAGVTVDHFKADCSRWSRTMVKILWPHVYAATPNATTGFRFELCSAGASASNTPPTASSSASTAGQTTPADNDIDPALLSSSSIPSIAVIRPGPSSIARNVLGALRGAFSPQDIYTARASTPVSLPYVETGLATLKSVLTDGVICALALTTQSR